MKHMKQHAASSGCQQHLKSDKHDRVVTHEDSEVGYICVRSVFLAFILFSVVVSFLLNTAHVSNC